METVESHSWFPPYRDDVLERRTKFPGREVPRVCCFSLRLRRHPSGGAAPLSATRPLIVWRVSQLGRFRFLRTVV
ncbi:hypothetical protein E2C01_044473 [Portunus trituberculatus]|uniref:Uncharacterized protein n=1 Tax=Portunus trituberculatus TaxID=210409 RepID=A0A5B7G2G1_PORTR|nr:hypothetical protein [Portunus trituberculatus]